MDHKKILNTCDINNMLFAEMCIRDSPSPHLLQPVVAVPFKTGEPFSVLLLQPGDIVHLFPDHAPLKGYGPVSYTHLPTWIITCWRKTLPPARREKPS